jgi:hypothetical protein
MAEVIAESREMELREQVKELQSEVTELKGGSI